MLNSANTSDSHSFSVTLSETNGFSDSRTASSDSSDPNSVRSILTSSILEEYEEEENCAEFEEILSAEVNVEVERLRELSKNGIPHHLRSKVWMYLLGVAQANRSMEVSVDWKMTSDYNALKKHDTQIIKLAKGEVKRYRPEVSWFQENNVKSLFERILSAYLTSHPHVEYSPNLVHLLGPLLYCIRKERDVYFCFEAFMTKYRILFSEECMSKQVSKFITLFQNLLPSLYDCFEDEEVEPSSWAASWLQSLLSKALPLKCVIRLWDTYLSSDEGFSLHPYVCLSILEMASEQLSEMESTELLVFLQRLPSQDMNQILSNAYNTKEKVAARNLI